MHQYIIILSVLIPGSLLHIIPVYPQPLQYNPRLSEAPEYNHYDIREPEGPGTYAFGYDLEDHNTGNTQFREEERHPNGTVTGSYGYVEPDGNLHVVHYVADERGYRVRIENSRDSKPVAGPKISNLRAQTKPAHNSNKYYRPNNGPIITRNPLPVAINPYSRPNYINQVVVPSNDLSPPIIVPDRNYNNYFAALDDRYYDNAPLPTDRRFSDQILPQNGLFYNTYYPTNSLQ